MFGKQSDNILPYVHKYMVDVLGQNYALDGCMSFLMECLGEDKTAFDYWFFSGLTGDNLTQLYCRDYSKTVYCLSSVVGHDYFKKLFDACGFEHTYVTNEERSANRLMYTNMLMEYIDRGIPVITRITPQNGRNGYTYYALICGYEEYGKSLLYLFDNSDELQRVDEDIAGDWIFAGRKRGNADVGRLYRDTVLNMSTLLNKTDVENCSFGAQAFRDWADVIENGRFDGETLDSFNKWRDHDTYVCILATNASCADFLERARNLNPDLTYMESIMAQYDRMKGLWDELEAVGGGFNATLDSLKDKEKRKVIADKIREFAVCYDRINAQLPEKA